MVSEHQSAFLLNLGEELLRTDKNLGALKLMFGALLLWEYILEHFFVQKGDSMAQKWPNGALKFNKITHFGELYFKTWSTNFPEKYIFRALRNKNAVWGAPSSMHSISTASRSFFGYYQKSVEIFLTKLENQPKICWYLKIMLNFGIN